MTWIPCLIPCFLLFWPIVLSPFLLLVVSCVRDMATVNLFLWRPKQKVYLQLNSFAVYAVVMRHLVTLFLQKRCQTNIFSPFSKQKARNGKFSFPCKLSRTCFDWSSKNCETFSNQKQALNVQHLSKSEREQAPLSLNVWVLVSLKDEWRFLKK